MCQLATALMHQPYLSYIACYSYSGINICYTSQYIAKTNPFSHTSYIIRANIYIFIYICIKIYRSNNNHIESYIILLQNRTDIYIGRQNVEKIYQYYTYQLQSFFVHSHSFFFGVLSFVCFEIISIHGRLNIDTFLDR